MTKLVGDSAPLLATKAYVLRRYGRYANVLAVGIGTKFKSAWPASRRSIRQVSVICIQFFVSRKRRVLPARQRLPRFVYRRMRDDRIDRRHRIPTDVIALGGLQAVCAAGDSLRSDGERGLITLIFRNKAEMRKRFYLISCAHVAGDLRRSPPAYAELYSDDSAANPIARTVVNSTAASEEIDYDIALARMEEGARPARELRIRGQHAPLRSFLPMRFLQPGAGVEVVLSRRTAHGTVESVHASARIGYRSGTFEVHNLWGLNVAAARGDSGGLVYRGSEAAGLVVAASPQGWLWFQPLEPAIRFLNRLSPVPVAVFNPATNP